MRLFCFQNLQNFSQVITFLKKVTITILQNSGQLMNLRIDYNLLNMVKSWQCHSWCESYTATRVKGSIVAELARQGFLSSMCRKMVT